MGIDRKLAAAISAAVNMYIEAEQQAALLIKPGIIREVPRPACNPWAMAGRQSAMDMRRLWQMRLVR